MNLWCLQEYKWNTIRNCPEWVSSWFLQLDPNTCLRKIRQGSECIAWPWTTSCPIWKVSARTSCVLLFSSHLQAGTELLPFGPCLWKSLTTHGIILTRLETLWGGWTNFFELLVHRALTTNMFLLLIRITSVIRSIAPVSHRKLQKWWLSLNFLPESIDTGEGLPLGWGL